MRNGNETESRRAFEALTNAFRELSAIHGESVEVAHEMKRTDRDLERYRLLDSRFNELQSEWSRAFRTYMDAQTLFAAQMRMLGFVRFPPET